MKSKLQQCINTKSEKPFSMYQGLKLHGQGRNKKHIEINHKQAIAVSYERIMDVKFGISHAVCTHHARDGVVLPTCSRRNIFTTHYVDNLDSKTKENFALDEFHGMPCVLQTIHTTITME